LDFAHARKHLAIALPASLTIDTYKVVDSLKMGLLPVGNIGARSGATYLNPRDPELRLDFLTTLHRGKAEPFEHAELGITLQPLKFMEYSLENVGQAAIFSAEGAVVVNIPHPARYALHKLLVYGERAGSFLQKAQKDLLQAAALLAYLKDRRAWEVEEAWADLLMRGKGWVTRARRGLTALDPIAPELRLREWLKLPRAASK
jgi:hypothetical protein